MMGTLPKSKVPDCRAEPNLMLSILRIAVSGLLCQPFIQTNRREGIVEGSVWKTMSKSLVVELRILCGDRRNFFKCD